MKIKVLYYIFFGLIIQNLVSCSKNDFKSKVEGQWAIEEISFSGKNYKDQLYSNVLIFKEQNQVSIPETFHFKKDGNANWRVLENNKGILINTSATVFNDTFDVKFINRTDTKPLGMILKSDKIYIKAFKLLDFQK